MLDTVLQYLREPLFELSGNRVTPLTLIVAIAIVIGSRIAASLIARSLERVLETRGLDRGMRFAASKITRYVIVTIGALVALGSMGVNMSAIMGAGAVLLVGIGFGLQKLAENFISGLLLLIERPVRKGDFLEVGGVLGTVEDIGLRATTVMSRDGVAVIVPNANLITAVVVNHTVPTRSKRIWLKFSVAYGTDLDRLVTLVKAIAVAEPGIANDPAPEVRHLGFGESALNFALLAWIHDARDELLVQSNLYFALDRGFREHRIVVPYPQRSVHMHTAA
jgi:small-conductance mechanosensitive channel